MPSDQVWVELDKIPFPKLKISPPNKLEISPVDLPECPKSCPSYPKWAPKSLSATKPVVLPPLFLEAQRSFLKLRRLLVLKPDPLPPLLLVILSRLAPLLYPWMLKNKRIITWRWPRKTWAEWLIRPNTEVRLPVITHTILLSQLSLSQERSILKLRLERPRTLLWALALSNRQNLWTIFRVLLLLQLLLEVPLPLLQLLLSSVRFSHQATSSMTSRITKSLTVIRASMNRP